LAPFDQAVSEEKICLTVANQKKRIALGGHVLLSQMEPNLAGSIYVRSSIKFLRFVLFGQQIWLPRAILVSDWLLLKKSSPLKLLGQMEPNLAGSIYVRYSIKLLLTVANQKKELLLAAIFVGQTERNEETL
jgi:uncharacterized membrane protein YqhA